MESAESKDVSNQVAVTTQNWKWASSSVCLCICGSNVAKTDTLLPIASTQALYYPFLEKFGAHLPGWVCVVKCGAPQKHGSRTRRITYFVSDDQSFRPMSF